MALALGTPLLQADEAPSGSRTEVSARERMAPHDGGRHRRTTTVSTRSCATALKHASMSGLPLKRSAHAHVSLPRGTALCVRVQIFDGAAVTQRLRAARIVSRPILASEGVPVSTHACCTCVHRGLSYCATHSGTVSFAGSAPCRARATASNRAGRALASSDHHLGAVNEEQQ